MKLATKSQIFYGVLALFCFCMAWGYMAFAQVPVSSPSPAIPVVVSSGGIWGWVAAHGGFQASVLLLVGSAFSLLSTIRLICAKFDGVEPGAAIPADKSALTLINKVCIVLGKILDFSQGNIQH